MRHAVQTIFLLTKLKRCEFDLQKLGAGIRRKTIATVVLIVITFVICTAAQANSAAVAQTQPPLTESIGLACSPPFTTPVYRQPANDGVALSSLLEGAGYGASTNSDWTDIASGNFCGGSAKELVLVKNKHSNFSIMRGPTPYAVGAFDDLSDALQPWRTVTAGNLDADAFDEIVAVRKVTTVGAPDVFVMKVNPTTCSDVIISASAPIGTPNSEWIDSAIGDFDGAGKQIALIERTSPAFQLARPFGRTLGRTFAGNLNTNASYPWKGIAAGDLDGDGIDELVATRKVSDGVGETVLVYKWLGSRFVLVASSRFGNTGNSDWTGVTVGDFNGDGRGAIALTKNAYANFVILDLPPGATTLRTVKTAGLDSVAGQDWRGVTATDWLGRDNGAAELVAVRKAQNPYRADLFVYGNPFHRVQRDSGLEGTRAEYDQRPVEFSSWVPPPPEHVALLTESHATTMNWALVEPDDYTQLVEFLAATETKNACIDGRRLRVSVTLIPKVACAADPISLPVDSPITPWNELAYFSSSDPIARCKDTLGWASLLGRLARDYPQIVSVGIDDFTHYVSQYPGEELAEAQSRIRQQAPWVSFVPTAYYGDLSKIPPDFARTIDTWLFYFRNEKAGQCLTDPCGTNSVGNAPGEIAAAASTLPAGRRIQVGAYWGRLWSQDPPQEASNRYDYDLVRLVRSIPSVAGVTAYPMTGKTPGVVCDEYNLLDDQFCTLQRVFGAPPPSSVHTDLTIVSGAPLAAGNPFTYVFPSHDVQNIIYRATDNHAHELWRTSGGIGHSDLTALAGAPNVVGDPTAYVFAAQDIQNVVYRGTDNAIHGLYWSCCAVGHDNLTALADAPLASGNPYGYVFDAIGYQNVLYHGTDGHLHGLYWSCCAVGHDDLTVLSGAPAPAGDPFGYVIDAIGYQNVLYRGVDSHLHGLYWSCCAVGHDDLTVLSGAPAPAGNAKAYVAAGWQNAFYRGADGHLHGLWWWTGAVGHDDLTYESKAPGPSGDPSAFYSPSDGRHHVVYRSADNHVRVLSWTVGFVTHDDLTLLARAPLATGDPSAYLAPDGTQHAIYRSADGHLHDLMFRH